MDCDSAVKNKDPCSIVDCDSAVKNTVKIPAVVDCDSAVKNIDPCSCGL